MQENKQKTKDAHLKNLLFALRIQSQIGFIQSYLQFTILLTMRYFENQIKRKYIEFNEHCFHDTGFKSQVKEVLA